MKYINVMIFISLIIMACDSRNTKSVIEKDNEYINNGITADSSVLKNEVQEQVKFIREKYSLINNELASKSYMVQKSVVESEGFSTTYVRAMDDGSIRYGLVSECNDHGCDQSSYFFWGNKLIFKFENISYWDELSELRTYYLNETEMLCLYKAKRGTGGYDVVNKQLSAILSDTLTCSGVFDRASIKYLLE